MPTSSSPSANLLIVDDDETIQRLLVLAAGEHGWRPAAAGSADEGLRLLDEHIEAVVLDHEMPGMNGSEMLVEMQRRFPGLPVIMLTGLNDARTAVDAVRAGAVDYLTKPFELKRLFELLQAARQEARSVPAATAGTSPAEGSGIRSSSPRVRELVRQIERAAKLDSTILLTGESGTGKTFYAREIHRLSPRAGAELITVSCPALPPQLLESELFGHERGAFTGATSSRAGRFEQASAGALFRDGIGDLPPELQPKLLNVLQDREFFRVGGSKLLRTDARLIAATNVDLRARVEAGTFREDLYYRLNIIELTIPPLRERLEDLPALTEGILARIARRRAAAPAALTPEAAGIMAAYDWPGNVRQLENVLERATAFADEALLDAADIAPLLETRRDLLPSAAAGRPATLQEIEREAFIRAYLRSGRNKARTARELGISERSVYNLIDRYDLKGT